jgi:uncharacterized protein YbjT (DUF2867 family)
MNKLNVIITGATGMVGEGVLYECLRHPDVENVLVISRRASGYSHPKLKEILHVNFFDITSLGTQLRGYNACMFCMGVTSVGRNEVEYTKLTHTLTLHVANLLSALNPGMTFCYISGAGTDSSERGRRMWARVKGKTENDLMKLPFKKVFNFRPAVIEPLLPLKPTQTYYRTIRAMAWLFPLLRRIAPNSISTLKDLATAMISCSLHGYDKNIIEARDINRLGRLNKDFKS